MVGVEQAMAAALALAEPVLRLVKLGILERLQVEPVGATEQEPAEYFRMAAAVEALARPVELEVSFLWVPAALVVLHIPLTISEH